MLGLPRYRFFLRRLPVFPPAAAASSSTAMHKHTNSTFISVLMLSDALAAQDFSSKRKTAKSGPAQLESLANASLLLLCGLASQPHLFRVSLHVVWGCAVGVVCVTICGCGNNY